MPAQHDRTHHPGGDRLVSWRWLAHGPYRSDEVDLDKGWHIQHPDGVARLGSTARPLFGRCLHAPAGQHHRQAVEHEGSHYALMPAPRSISGRGAVPPRR
jgi:hypothetical protein